jgi:hypothetical protein
MSTLFQLFSADRNETNMSPFRKRGGCGQRVRRVREQGGKGENAAAIFFLPDKADVGSEATMESAAICTEKDAKGNARPAVVVDTCMAVETALFPTRQA